MSKGDAHGNTLLLTVGLACALALISLGGGLYEFSVIDPAWPRRPDVIQPARGGVSRRWFWIPAHVAMRAWSAFDFIPKALAFEQAEPSTIDETSARRWTRRSRFRMPLDVLTCVAMLRAFAEVTRLG